MLRFFFLVICIGISLYSFSFVRFFFFKQKTAYEMRISDWSSDVCSSDLAQRLIFQHGVGEQVKLVLMTLQYFLRPRIALLDQPANFLVDQLRRLVRHVDALALRIAEEGFALLLLKIGRASCRERVCQYV